MKKYERIDPKSCQLFQDLKECDLKQEPEDFEKKSFKLKQFNFLGKWIKALML